MSATQSVGSPAHTAVAVTALTTLRTFTSPTTRATLLAALLAFTLAACSTLPENRTVSLPEVPAQNELLTPAQREHQRILAAYGGQYDAPALEAMVTRTVDRLVAASERPDLKYKVVILNSPAINAFALPNGQLYVSRGLLALANDNAELASVLSHEMAHVIAKHADIRENQARQSAIIASVATDVLGDPEIGALALAKSKLALASFSRAQEFEADGIGVGIAARAGYDPYGAVRFLSEMQRNADLKTPGGDPDPRARDFLATHPATPDRIKNAQANARQFSGPGTGTREHAEYLDRINGLVYGEDPSEGFARGRRFLHPKLGFTFVAPAGFTLDNTAQAVLGIRDNGKEAMRLDVVQVPAQQSLPDYLRSGWIENVEAPSTEEFTVNGFPTAGATARGSEWTFRIYALRYGSEVYRFIYAAKQRTPDTDRAFRSSLDTFRRMTLKEAQDVRPYRLRIVAVHASDTIDSLSRRMAPPDRKRERFMVLNGLSAGDRLKVGERVKIVVE